MVAAPTLLSRSADAVDSDALVILLAQGDQPGTAQPLGPVPAVLTDELADSIAALRLTGKAEEVTVIPAPAVMRADVVVTVGVGSGDPDAETIRRSVGAAVRALSGRAAIAVLAPGDEAATVAACAEGATLGGYAFTRYRASQTSEPPQITVLTAKARTRDVKSAVARAHITATAAMAVRDLVNTAPNDLYPEAFAEIARKAASGTKVKVSTLDDQALRAGGFGGLVGVGQGSTRPPRLVTLGYEPTRAKAHVALVGKGITFDSGGLSLKPPTGMTTMKTDMTGAATVLHAVLAAEALALPIAVTGFLALAENMPSGGAQRPGDIVTMRNGTTVEVLNTDAEGRLVMADALTEAIALEPDAVIDIATLTGAQMVALGPRVAGVMGTPEVRDSIVTRATAAGESAWAMPLPEDLREGLNSPVADLANIGGKFGGMLTAGLFLREFVGTTPWGHIDIAGPSFNESGPWGYTPKGGTGYGLRTLVGYLETFTEK